MRAIHRLPLWLGLGLAIGVPLAGAEEPMPGEGASATPALQAAESDPTTGASAARIPAPPIDDEARIVPLSLGEAIASGLERNLALEVQRHAPWIAREGYRAAIGAYDPVFGGELGYGSTETPIANPLLNAGAVGQDAALLNHPDQLEEKRTDGKTGLQGLVPWLGAEYGLAYTGSRLGTTSSIASYEPELRSSLIGTLSIPLLRDLIYNQAWTELRVTRLGVDTADETFRAALLDTVLGIEASYWELVAARERERVARKSVDTARALLDQVKTQYEVGVVSKVEVVEAEAGVAERDFNLIVAANEQRLRQDQLADLVFGPDLRATSRFEIQPTDKPSEQITYETDAGVAVRRALENRPELAAARRQMEILEERLAYAKNQKLPKLDVVGTYGYSGLAGDPHRSGLSSATTPLPVNLGRNYGNTHDDYFTRDGSLTWSARGVVSYPLGNQTADARATAAALELRRQRTETRRVEQGIVLQVREALRNLDSAKQGIEAAARRQAAAAEQLRAERIRQEQGESTPFDVLQRERDFVDSEANRIGAERAYRVNAARLERAVGTSLDSNHIVVENARTLR